MEKIKKSLKKANRGLVLGLILIIAVVIYIMIDNHNFKSEKPAIEKNITAFVEQMGEYMVLPEEYRTTDSEHKGKVLTEPEKENLKAKWVDFVEKYWAYKDYSNNDYFYGQNIISMKNSYDSILDQLPADYITTYSSSVKNISIKKAGPECATCETTLNFIIEVTNQAQIMTPAYLDSFGYYEFVEYDENGNMIATSENSRELTKYSCEGTFTFNLERVDGEWKINSSEGYILTMQQINTDTKQEGGEG